MHLKISIIVLLSLFVSNLMAEVLTIPEDKTFILFPAKPGNVTFAHKKHADLSITQCTSCHHKYQPDDTVMKPCHECHKHKADNSEPPQTKTAFHTRCIGCHEYTIASGEQAGPVKKKCKLCHVK
jgi:hypothetical protein